MLTKLRALRRGLALSQGELARLVGTHQQTISAYERGLAPPDLLVVSRLAAALGVSERTLLGNRQEARRAAR